MADKNQEAWWARTEALAVATLGGAAIAGLFLILLFPVLDGVTPLGFPLGYLLAAEGLPLAFVLLLFWHARRQEDTDRAHSLHED
jgi:putative solute:sodium symporter small subunit